ncbi:hypothetical protein C5167_028789 [Papaver somniferum]|uniref:uncharacterized protein LOC113338306 n=1 Tax=Papaver somniferum TaxID=3469 RepID=UPI000E6FB7F5|nr:uncharacterized protein LOC113338306 [Papaver somniferum]RZC90963.1 hypothetical protein C5167_028789 [Papaver somniferum]
MGLLAKVVLCIILLHHLHWCSGYVQGYENNVERGQRINRQLISGGGRGGGRSSGSSSSSSNHGSGSASRKSPHPSTGNDKSYGSGTASKKSPFTPYGVVYAAGAANHQNNNNNHRNMAAPLSCNRNNIGLLFTAQLIVSILLVVASS